MLAHLSTDAGQSMTTGLKADSGRATPHCPHRLTIPGVYSHPPRRAGTEGKVYNKQPLPVMVGVQVARVS